MTDQEQQNERMRTEYAAFLSRFRAGLAAAQKADSPDIVSEYWSNLFLG